MLKIFGRVRGLLKELRESKSYALRDLSRGQIPVKARINEGSPGVYLFSHTLTKEPAYVGRSRNLPKRVGFNHRSLAENQAAFVKHLRKRHGLASMQAAREIAFRDYSVQFLVVPDVWTRAVLELYVSQTLKTWNDFLEH